MVVAQLAERSLPRPEICCSNPNIGNDKFVFVNLSVNSTPEKKKIKKKRPGKARFLSLY